MPNSIIITKLSNGNVLVENDGILNTFNPDAQCYLVQNSVEVKDKSGSKITTFNEADVLKVVRDTGLEVAINDVNTLFSELVNFFLNP